ncbi:MAG: Ig-like domain-containing protein [Planctomycetes bacterium]|nr:Ig-like domain-containing protein [Planctomycetota bacterium]
MTDRIRIPAERPRAAWAVGLALFAAVALPGCDNPACVFGGTCNPDGTPGGSNPPTPPANHAWLRDGAPTLSTSFPTGTGASLQTSIGLVFSESMAASGFTQAFELITVASPVPVPVVVSALVADGRMWVGASAVPLTASTQYSLRVVENRTLTDLQGVPLVLPADRILATFTTAATNPAAPRVVGSFPVDGAANESATGEIVVLFDRPLNPLSVTTASFAVTVDGATPANNPAPQALSLSGAASDPRVYRYRSVDASGEAVAFAPSATVQLELSPSSAPIVAPTGSGSATTQLPRTLIDFRTAALPAPRAALITSNPSDAIGVANLDGTTPLEISLDLADAQVGDTLRIYVFGATREAQPRPLLLSRSAALTGALFDVNTQVATIGEAQLDLAAGTTNLTPRIAEGSLQIAFALARGTYQTPVRLMDIDATSAGAQGPVLDVTPPTLVGLSSTGTNVATFVSDQRDVVIVGRADEEIRACEVTLGGGANNGVQAQTVAANAQGVFIAAPVALGVVAGASQPLTADVVIYDRAFNRAVSTTQVAVRQVGGVGPAAAVPGAAQLEVEVRDARTLAPLAGARVFTHEDQAGVVTQVAFTTTDANGRAQLNLGAVGEALVTVEATGFNLLTIHGVRAARVSLLLEATTPALSASTGTLTSSLTALSSLDSFAADTRVVDGASATAVVQACAAAGTQLACPFGPIPIRAAAPGAISVFATDPPATAFTFAPNSFLRGFALQAPLAATTAPAAVTAVELDSFLDAATVAIEDRALAGPSAALDLSALNALDVSNLNGDPQVTIQGSIPGLPGPFVAGLGLALDPLGTPPLAWQLRSAFPGAVDPTDNKYAGDELGSLVQRGTLAPELFLCVDVRDDFGARTLSRTPLASVGPTILPPEPPVVLAPTLGSTVVGPTYNVQFTDTLAGAPANGLYRVTLVGTGGRRWTLWRPDGSGGTRTVRLPDLAPAGQPLLPGSVAVSVTAYSYPELDLAEFLFSDLDKRAHVRADGPPLLFTQN